MRTLYFDVNNEDIGLRIDIFLVNKLKLSRSQIQKIIFQNRVSVNSNTIKHNYKLKKKDDVAVELEEPKELDIKPENIPLNILYEDNHVIIVNKKRGMVVHPAPGNYNGTLVNALLYHCKGNLSAINGVLRPGIVHRIDKDTTGILVAAKSNEAHIGLSVQLAQHSMKREYNAIVINNLNSDAGTINQPIGRHPKMRKKMVVSFKNSKNAITHYKVIERFKKYTFIELKLETGRTHQIRVHMAFNGNPLLGDQVYGGISAKKFGFEGQALHAKVLGFNHPVTNKYMQFESELPKEFINALEKIRKLQL